MTKELLLGEFLSMFICEYDFDVTVQWNGDTVTFCGPDKDNPVMYSDLDAHIHHYGYRIDGKKLVVI